MVKLQIKQVEGLSDALKVPFSVLNTEPVDPVENQVWFNPSNGALSIFLVTEEIGEWIRIN